MSDMVNRFNTSNKPRVKEARTIPEEAVNFVDQQNEFQDQITNFPRLRHTTYTYRALDYYLDERKNMVIPQSFHPADDGIDLNRWGPGHGYYKPGTPLS